MPFGHCQWIFNVFRNCRRIFNVNTFSKYCRHANRSRVQKAGTAFFLNYVVLGKRGALGKGGAAHSGMAWPMCIHCWAGMLLALHALQHSSTWILVYNG